MRPLLSKVASLPREQPFLFGVGLTSVKTAAADLLTQRAALGRVWQEVDVRRVGVFALCTCFANFQPSFPCTL